MLQKSYYHAWNSHEILHWMSHKNKKLKKKSFERMQVFFVCMVISNEVEPAAVGRIGA